MNDTREAFNSAQHATRTLGLAPTLALVHLVLGALHEVLFGLLHMHVVLLGQGLSRCLRRFLLTITIGKHNQTQAVRWPVV